MPCPTERTAPAIDARRCPLCGTDNRCAMEAARDAPGVDGATRCWCMVTNIAPGVLDRIPAALRGQACICAQCAQGAAGL